MRDRRRMLVTGAKGMVGSYVPEAFADLDLVLTDKVEPLKFLDVRDPEAVRRSVAEIRPHVVLHLAAATDVDRCEQDSDWAFNNNAMGTQHVALACAAYNAIMVYISTGGVFSGEKPTPYHEFDTPGPVNVYGQTKLAGEEVVKALLRRYYIIRAGWMFGGGSREHKFVGAVVRKLLAGATELKVVDDKIGSPTYAKDLMHGVRRLLETGYFGLYHMANGGMCSRYEVALALREILGRPGVEVVPVSSAYFPLPAPRARSEAIDPLKLRLLGLQWMRPWREALAEYVTGELLPALQVSASPEEP